MCCVKLMIIISVVAKYGIAGLSDKKNMIWDYTASPEDIRNNQIELMKLYMNTSMDPCEDFYEYSCGNWKNADELHSTIKVAPRVLASKIQQVLKEFMEGSSENGDKNEEIFTVFYKSCMNTTLISERGNKPAIDFLQTLDGWPMVDSTSSDEYVDWLNLSAKIALYGEEYILKAIVDPRVDNKTHGPVIYIMPTYSYSNYDEAELEEITTFIIGEPLNATILDEITIFEESFRNVCSLYYENSTILTLEELLNEESNIDWVRYLSILLQKPVNTSQYVNAPLNCLKEVGEFLSNTSSRIIANYILYNAMADIVYGLTNINETSRGASTRDEYCTYYTQEYFSTSISKMFVEKYLDESANNRAIELGEEIREAFTEFIGNIFWIDEPTKQIAQQKVNGIQLNVGYKPEYFQTYFDYPDIKFEEYFENSMKLIQHSVKSLSIMMTTENPDIAKFLPQFDMAAFFNIERYTVGEVYITAAMLQPPLFNNYFPNWSNYGGIGYIIGHELTHGFNIKFIKARENETDSEWWTPKSFKQYMIRTLCYNFQYDKYAFEDMELSVDGQNTLNENMADNGGLKFGYEAYKKWLNNNKNSDENQVNPVLNLTGEQSYFVSFAQTLCSSEDKEKIAERLISDPHTPPEYRVIGSVTNSFDFAKAFQCPVGSPMNPARKCRF